MATERLDVPGTKGPAPDVGSTVPVPALVAGVVAIVLILGGLVFWWSSRGSDARRPLILATGPEEGAYHALGGALARLIEDEGLAPSVTVRATEGSR